MKSNVLLSPLIICHSSETRKCTDLSVLWVRRMFSESPTESRLEQQQQRPSNKENLPTRQPVRTKVNNTKKKTLSTNWRHPQNVEFFQKLGTCALALSRFAIAFTPNVKELSLNLNANKYLISCYCCAIQMLISKILKSINICRNAAYAIHMYICM